MTPGGEDPRDGLEIEDGPPGDAPGFGVGDAPEPERRAEPGGEEPEGASEQRVTWLELFFDLIFVTAFDQLAKRLGDAPTAANLGIFGLMFVAVWWAWAGNTTFAGRYGNDSRAYRWGTLVQLVTLGAISLTLRGDLDQTGAAFAIAYGANRLTLVGMSLLTLRTHPQTATFARATAMGFGVAAAVWLVSGLFGGAVQLALWGVALLIDIFTPLVIRERQGQALPHQDHLPERVGLLQIIALGGIVTEAVTGGRQQQLTWLEQAPALLALVIALGLWRLYFDQARALPVLAAHRAGRTGSLLAWLYGHLPFTLSIIMLAVGLGHGISDENDARDAVNRLYVAWPLFGATLTLLFLRWNALRVAGRPFPDRSALAIGAAALLSLSLAWLPLDTLATHAAACTIVLGAALITARDPATHRLGKMEEELGASGTPV